MTWIEALGSVMGFCFSPVVVIAVLVLTMIVAVAIVVMAVGEGKSGWWFVPLAGYALLVVTTAVWISSNFQTFAWIVRA